MLNYNKHLDNVVRRKPTYGNGLRLDKSERLTPIPQHLWEKFKTQITQEDFSLYPDPTSFIEKLAEFHDIESKNICLNFGSDSSIRTIFEAFCKPGGNVITSNPCFPMYEVYAKEFQCELRGVEYIEENGVLKYGNIIDSKKIDMDTNLVILANPNSPIGDCIDEEYLKELIGCCSIWDIPLVIDEAYLEFSGQQSLDIVPFAIQNLIITKTFSKALGAAGCRLGYTIANQNIISILEKLKPTFEITGPSLKYAEFILDNYDEIVKPYVEAVQKEKHDMFFKLKGAGYEVLGSHANWLHIKEREDGDLTKTLNIFNISYKGGLTIPHKGSNWIRLSIVPGFSNSECFKQIIKPK